MRLIAHPYGWGNMLIALACILERAAFYLAFRASMAVRTFRFYAAAGKPGWDSFRIQGKAIMNEYNVIYADPPWAYRNQRTGGSMCSGASQKYSVMSLEEICALPVCDLTARDSVLFLWVTTPMMDEGLQVMKAWGFKYKTKIYWRKIMSLGMGYWFRGQVEELWLGVRGHVKAFRLQECNIIQCKALAHSQKPEEFRQLIERATGKMPDRRMLELFARRKYSNWSVWGNEVVSDIEINTLELT